MIKFDKFNYVNMKLAKFIPIIFILLLTSCEKDNNHPVPFVLTNEYININLPSYSNLQSVGGWAYISGGNKGIFVYRQSLDVFMAYDRMSPSIDGANCEPIYYDEVNGIKLIDDCTNSEFSAIDGAKLSGNAAYPLRGYLTSFDGVNTLHVYN